MKKANLALISALAALALGHTASAQTTIVSDNCTAANVNNGFELGEGVNSGINPPTTRLTGSLAPILRYFQTSSGQRPSTSYTIGNNRIRVAAGAQSGRFSISENGSTPFDFAPALGLAGASSTNTAKYDVKISMRNDTSGTQRFSFGLTTAEGVVDVWDFGVQLYHGAAGDNFYTIRKRVDTASAGLAADLNAVMGTTAAGTWASGGGSMIDFLIRVDDAGMEAGTNYNSRIQVATISGSTTNWIYDTAADSALTNRFRFDGRTRYFSWDQAGGTAEVFYDNFSVVSTYAPPPPPTQVWTGAGSDDNWSTGANWDGTAPLNGEPLLFGLSARQSNFNDIASLVTPTVTFTNGGFVLAGNMLSIESSISNLAGINNINLNLDWPTTTAKTWEIAAGSELSLGGSSTIATAGNHTLRGGGTLRLTSSMTINATPAFIIGEGRFVLDGGTFTSLGGFRIGSFAAASTPVEVVVSNGASLNLNLAAANLRVGDGADSVPSRLIVNNGSVNMLFGSLGIPYDAGSTGEVLQTGGLVKDCYVVFSDGGAGTGLYTVNGGTVEPLQIRKDTAAGLATMRFNNAILRPGVGTTNGYNFMTGLDVAEIQAGGLTLDATANITIGQLLSGAGGLTKASGAVATLTGPNTYAGNTLVQAGKLVLPNVQTNSSSILVDSSAELGVLQVAPSGSLTAGSLSLATSTLTFDLGVLGNPTAPMIKVNSLSASGGAGSVTINITGGLGILPGTITLVDYSGAIGGGYASFTLAAPPGMTATLVDNVANSSIDLSITAAPGLRWTGTSGSAWDYGTANWYNYETAGASTYSDGKPLWFVDGAATGTVNLTPATFTPTLITVSNAALNYVWDNGTVQTPLLRKVGSGSVTRVGGEQDQILQLELNAGSFVVSNTLNTNFASVLLDATGGTGTFVKRGAGTLTMSAGNSNSTFDGSTIIQDGILKLGDTRALGATNATVTISNNGTLDLVDHQPKQPVIVSGTGTGGIGAIIDSATATGVEENLLDVTMAGPTTFGCPNAGRWDLRANSSTGPAPGLKGNGYALTKVGSGTVSIACERTTTGSWNLNLGDVLVKEGTLTFAEAVTPGNPAAALAIYPTATLSIFDLGLTNPLVRNITMTNATLQGEGPSGHTNVVSGNILMSGNCRLIANDGRLIINGNISGAATVAYTSISTARLYLNGNNTYTGATTVTNGYFGGFGSLAGNLIITGGNFTPGSDSVGTFTVNGNVQLGGNTRMELDRSLAPNSDRVSAGGTITFGGDLLVTLASGAPAPQSGDVFQLFNKGSASPFASISLPALTSGLLWNTNNLMANGSISVSSATPPNIGSVGLIDGDLVLSGSGGTEGATYVIVSSEDVTVPMAGWTPVYTNVFGPGGTFSYTNTVSPGTPASFFRLSVP